MPRDLGDSLIKRGDYRKGLYYLKKVKRGIDYTSRVDRMTRRKESILHPRVSVVLPTYNHLQFLPVAIGSILNQTYNDFELIIVNDGSTDGSYEYLNSLEDPRIQVIHQENKRLPQALNTGFAAAHGELFTWVSADNYYAPIFLEALVAALDAYPKAGFAYSGFAIVDKEGRITGIKSNQDVSYRRLLVRNPGIASFMYRRICQESVGLYRPEFEGAEDWDMWIRICREFPVVYVPEILCYYRDHPQSMTFQKREQIERATLEVFKGAIQREEGGFEITKLYPGLPFCQDKELARFYALFDFGNLLLRSRFSSIAYQILESALSMVQDSFAVKSNLAFAYAKAGRWDEAIRLVEMLKNINHPVVRNICESIKMAYGEKSLHPLKGVTQLFSVSRSVELFQYEEKYTFSYTESLLNK